MSLVSIGPAPDFLIKVGQIIHNHSISISFLQQDQPNKSKNKKFLYSHRSQIELIKYLRLRLAIRAKLVNATVNWEWSDNISGTIVGTDSETIFEYKLPNQLSKDLKAGIYIEFMKKINLFVKSQTTQSCS